MWGHKELTTMKDDNRRLEFFTRNELARRWQVSVETLKRRERAGLLPAFKFGRGIGYRSTDVEIIEAKAIVTR